MKIPVKYCGCLIYTFQQSLNPVFKIVEKGVTKAERGTFNGAKIAAKQKPWNWKS